jgi:Xaa-Pro dipeptidase
MSREKERALTPQPKWIRIDFSARIAKMRRVLDEQGLDTAVVMSPANIAYLSGFHALIYSRPIYLVIDRQSTMLIVPGLEEEHAGHAEGIDRVVVYYEHPEKGKPGENAPDTLATELAASKQSGIGIEYGSAPVALRERIEQAGMRTGDVTPALIRMRLIKEPAEIELMKQAAALARIGVMTTLEAAAPGLSQLAIDSLGTNAILEAAPELTPGATINPFGFTTSGPETSLPHLITTTRRLTDPDIAIHSRQVSVDGERAELERTFAIGSMSGQVLDVFNVAEAAQRAAIDACGAGRPMREVDAAARSIIQKAGYGAYSIHRTGHGLGIEPHEAPYIRWDNDAPLEAGMVVSIEPGIYIPGVCGARHSDTVVVTEGAPLVITDAPYGADNLTFHRAQNPADSRRLTADS